MPDDSPHPHSGVPIERAVAGGEGLGRLSDGRAVFVRGGIPGDLATIEVVDERRDWARPLSRASRPHHRNGAHQHVPLEVLVVGGVIGQKFFPSTSLNLKQASLLRRFVARRKWTTNQRSARGYSQRLPLWCSGHRNRRSPSGVSKGCRRFECSGGSLRDSGSCACRNDRIDHGRSRY